MEDFDIILQYVHTEFIYVYMQYTFLSNSFNFWEGTGTLQISLLTSIFCDDQKCTALLSTLFLGGDHQCNPLSQLFFRRPNQNTGISYHLYLWEVIKNVLLFLISFISGSTLEINYYKCSANGNIQVVKIVLLERTGQSSD